MNGIGQRGKFTAGIGLAHNNTAVGLNCLKTRPGSANIGCQQHPQHPASTLGINKELIEYTRMVYLAALLVHVTDTHKKTGRQPFDCRPATAANANYCQFFSGTRRGAIMCSGLRISISISSSSRFSSRTNSSTPRPLSSA